MASRTEDVVSMGDGYFSLFFCFFFSFLMKIKRGGLTHVPSKVQAFDIAGSAAAAADLDAVIISIELSTP